MNWIASRNTVEEHAKFQELKVFKGMASLFYNDPFPMWDMMPSQSLSQVADYGSTAQIHVGNIAACLST